MNKTKPARSIGYMDRNGNIVYTLPYRIEKAWYVFRMFLSYLILPERRVKRDSVEREFQRRIQLHRDWAKDVRGRDKAIARLQRQIKELKYQLRQAGGNERST